MLLACALNNSKLRYPLKNRPTHATKTVASLPHYENSSSVYLKKRSSVTSALLSTPERYIEATAYQALLGDDTRETLALLI